MGFIKAYLKSMRPYTFFITGIAGLIGMLLVKSSVSLLQKIIVLVLLFFSYGVNQVINDLIGVKEDKINSPKRPSISGELNKRKAIILTIFIFIFGAILTYFFNPYALVIYFLGYFANFLYEYLKRIPLLGNLWFGLMISLAPIYGALAITDLSLAQSINNLNLLCTAFLIALSSSAMCYFTYFKDYKGDKKENINTLVVILSHKPPFFLNSFMNLVPFLFLITIFLLELWTLEINIVFLILVFIAFILTQYTSYLFSKSTVNYKKSLELNFESTVLFQISILALINPLLSTILFVSSFLIIKIIFNKMYKEELY
ncbi:MAG: UbiA family prenyltransferase [Candidatus Pacearchaeota archaeon]|nr:UbiA family prenyltransferase [Candidatus Pacearchaeota archaeon]